ncbi:flagellar assembly protein FliH [Sulfurimonas lithotrophica]|uniref:Flagellar assembly protein FliH n=1 Tax=Sulfurimonas lithotrophica TaxID=2590022 RepID=A0A5P8NZ36_9BACT|nr:flagellar assembly protein FliH [Sulfurimonas lithotrophica]QFR48698.1 flagellar assembly protein FliH [Sulfurimonas lithotrophica]
MAKVISENKLSKHTMDKYKFKVFSMNVGSNEENKEQVGTSSLQETSAESKTQEKQEIQNVDSSSLSTNSKDSLIESLMKKTDEMSSNFIKLQMKLENMSDEHKLELQKVKDEAFEKGVEEGLEQAKKNQDNNVANSLNQFIASVETLGQSAKEFESALEGIKSSLLEAACDIAKEVISIELSDNSNEIAKVLSEELINELQSASKVKLKVNPKNHGAISEAVGSDERIEVLADNAVSEGGVVVLSDAGNIDAQIKKRFERVKRAALSE